MGWNGSGNGNADGDATRRPVKRSSNGAARGLVAGLVVVAGAAVCWLLLTGREEPQPERPDKGERGLIGEVTPAAAPTNAVEVGAAQKEPRQQKVGEIRDGMIMLCNGKLHKVKGIVTNLSGVAKMDYEIFEHPSENIIAGLLSIRPGQTLVGTPRYNGQVRKDFLESLKEQIVILADDSERDKELKQAVIDAKKELKAAHERGEDIEQILLDSRAEMQKLGRYKQELREMAIKELSAAATEEEMDDYVRAANRMLEERGIAPLDLSPIARIKFRMKQDLISRRKGE